MERTEAQSLDEIRHTLVDGHGCHTVILYGSRARGDSDKSSDWDVLGVRPAGEASRAARDLHGAWLDAFVYPESHFATLDEGSLRFLGGKLLVDTRGYGAKLVERIRVFEAKGPKALEETAEESLRVWYGKMLERIARGDLEASYRRTWLLFEALESYFRLRRHWYRGPKQSFAFLAKNDPEAHEAFARALAPSASFEDLSALVQCVLAAQSTAG